MMDGSFFIVFSCEIARSQVSVRLSHPFGFEHRNTDCMNGMHASTLPTYSRKDRNEMANQVPLLQQAAKAVSQQNTVRWSLGVESQKFIRQQGGAE